MRITIDLDSTVGAINVSNPASAEGESLTQPAAQSAVQGAALDAGAYSGVALVRERPSAEGAAVVPTVVQLAIQGAGQNAGAYSGETFIEEHTAVPLPVINAGIAAAEGSPPSPHLDTFGLLTVVSLSKDGLDAGYPKN